MSQTKKNYDYMFKVILIGLSTVGKSSILLRYTRNQFSEDLQGTIGVQYATKTVITEQGTKIKLQIWDTAGQERYRALMKTFYRGCSTAIFVYDVTKEDSFKNLDKEMQVTKDFCKNEPIMMVVGNKIDLEEERTVSKQEGLDFAESRKVAFYEVSAKNGTNIDLIFQRIAQELQKAVAQPVTMASESMNSPNKDNLQKVDLKHNESIVLDKKGEEQRKKQTQQKKKCCS